ncbi:MAG: hypothetical protein KDC44_15130, partial [Phaeodactylibacter sp.]|nr:hypothetical protein [Phaeodactylibacter sp.]
MEGKKLINQYGDKSVYIEQNTGNIHIHPTDGEMQIFDLRIFQDLENLQNLLGVVAAEVVSLAHKMTPVDLTPATLTRNPFLPEVLIGREKDLQQLRKELAGGNNLLLLVNGKGGIGKTSLAAKYYWEYGQEYRHRAWVLKEQSIGTALLELALPLGLKFQETQSTDSRIKQLFTALQALKEPCLLVIDNANDLEDLKTWYNELRRLQQFHLILTTRIEKFSKAPLFKVGGLEEQKAIELFENYAEQKLNPEE